MIKELRIPVEDPEEVAEKLIDEAEAREVDIVDQKDVYYGSIKLYEKMDKPFLLRIREESSKVFLEYKSQSDGAVERKKILVESPDEAREIFEAIGLEEVLEIEKKRRKFELGRMDVNVDSIDSLGDFIEFRIPEEDGRAPAESALEAIGKEKEDLTDQSYVSMLLEGEDKKFSDWLEV